VALLSLPSGASAQTSPFFGKWADSAAECPSAYRVYGEKAVTTIYPKAAMMPTETCRVASIKQQNDKQFVIRMSCKDATGGDGPSNYTVSETLTVISPLELSYTSSMAKGQVFKKRRCN
jgi:hypothetical protein